MNYRSLNGVPENLHHGNSNIKKCLLDLETLVVTPLGSWILTSSYHKRQYLLVHRYLAFAFCGM
jgi:hypothetical protein